MFKETYKSGYQQFMATFRGMSLRITKVGERYDLSCDLRYVASFNTLEEAKNYVFN